MTISPGFDTFTKIVALFYTNSLVILLSLAGIPQTHRVQQNLLHSRSTLSCIIYTPFYYRTERRRRHLNRSSARRAFLIPNLSISLLTPCLPLSLSFRTISRSTQPKIRGLVAPTFDYTPRRVYRRYTPGKGKM